MFYEVILGKGVGRLDTALTYRYEGAELATGTIVEVPIGSGKAPGVVVKKVAQPGFACKEIARVLYSKPLPRHLTAAALWIHGYYLAPLSGCFSLILPAGALKQPQEQKTEQKGHHTAEQAEQIFPNKVDLTMAEGKIRLNLAQKKALEGLQQAAGATKLLFGVTGSGKTNIYLKMAVNALKREKSVVLLVPEIALTGQLVQIFREMFGEMVTLIHSKQTEAERRRIFDSLLTTSGPRVVVGPRSALFAPLDNLGLIIIDEEHETAYYQENTPKYSAIRVASMMAREVGGEVILGSATPAVEDFYIAKKRGALVKLTEKAKDTAVTPEVKIVDFKRREAFSRNRYFSDALIRAIKTNLEQGRQTLIFHNRRGSSPLTICDNCGEEIECPNCFLPLTLHADTYELICHTCGYRSKVPSGCPKCGAAGLVHKGFGTKLLENEVKKLFPEARVRRFDGDTKKGEGLDEVYGEVKSGEVDILVGTQTLAKGLDLPKLATVGVVQADAGLILPDFAAEERVFQLITQVIGRVGRGHLNVAEVFVQTFRPEHPVLEFAAHEDYEGFAEYLLKQRRRGGFPPYRYVMRLDITLKTEALVIRKVRAEAARLKRDARLLVSPPMPAFHEHTAKGYNWEIVVRSASRQALVEATAGLDRNFRVALDVPSLL